MIRFNLLGEIDLRGGDGPQIDQILRQPKRLALLAYLAAPVPGTWHRRDTLLGLFWSELDTSHARTSLRNALYVIRQCLGDDALLGRGDEEVAVNPEWIETDLATVGEALRDGRAADALSAYQGELLPGLYPPESDGFQRWLDGERTRLRIVVSKAGLEHAVTLGEGGHLEQARRIARRVVDINPDDEVALRQLMTLHQAMGDRSGGLAAFEDYRLRLAREFEAEPAPETMALAEQMRVVGETMPVRPPAPTAPASDAAAPTGPPRTDRRSGDGQQSVARRDFHRSAIVLGVIGGIVLAFVGWRLTRSAPFPSIGKSSPITADEGLQIEPSISPSGRLVAYAQGNPQRMRIFIRRIDGGAPWPLSGDSNSVEILPHWSPDNDQLVFLARNNAYVAAAVGGAPRLVASGSEGEGMVRSASWSPNGDSIVIVRNDSVLARPLEGPGYRLIGRGTQLHSCTWSPDNKWIACVTGNWIAFVPGTLFGNQAPSGIVLFPVAGGEAMALTDREHAFLSPAWSADGRRLWMLSNIDGVWGEVYAVRITADGRADGAYRRMGLSAETISVAGDRLAYSVYSRRANIWSFPIDPIRVLTPAAATPVTAGNQIVEVLHASRDGQWLVYDSDVRGNADIYRVPTAGGRADRLTDDPRPEYGGDLSPDNRHIAYQLWTGGQRRLFIRDLRTGVAAEAVSAPGDQGVPRWSPTGSAMAVWEHGSEPGSIFVIHRDSTGNWGKAAWTLRGAQLPVWSPDGGTLAYLTPEGSINLVPADSGAVRALFTPKSGGNDPIATFLAWDSGQDALWFLGHDSLGRGGIWAMPLDGGRPRLLVDLRDPQGRVNGPTLTSDGTRFYITLDERLSNVRWAELVRR